MSSREEKEINYLIYLKGQLIKQTKKEIKQLQKEKQQKILIKKKKGK